MKLDKYTQSILSTISVGRLGLADDFPTTWARHCLAGTLADGRKADNGDPCAGWAGCRADLFGAQLRDIAIGACSTLPPRVEDAQKSAERRFHAWSTALTGEPVDGLISHLAQWWVGGATTGLDGLRRYDALQQAIARRLESARKILDDADERIAAAQRELDREQRLSSAVADAMSERQPIGLTLTHPLVIAGFLGGFGALTMLLGGESWQAVAAAGAVGFAGSWVWLRIGWPLLRRSANEPNAAKAALHANKRLKDVFEQYWRQRARTETAHAEVRLLQQATLQLNRFEHATTLAAALRGADAAAAGARAGRSPFVERSPGDIALDGGAVIDAMPAADQCQAGAAAVDAAIHGLVTSGAAPDADAVVRAVAAALPAVSVSEVIEHLLKAPAVHEQFVGHLRAMVGATAAGAGRLPSDVHLDPYLTSSTLTFGLPGGPADPLSALIRTIFPGAAVIHSTDRGAVEVIADMQNLRFDQLTWAEEAASAYAATPHAERELWHFPTIGTSPQSLVVFPVAPTDGRIDSPGSDANTERRGGYVRPSLHLGGPHEHLIVPPR